MKPYFDDGKGHVIYNADCREMLPVISRVDLVLADPPYNVALGSKSHSYRQSGYSQKTNDNREDSEYSGWLLSVFKLAQNISPRLVITPGNSNQHMYPKPLWTMAWTKSNGVTRTPLTRGQKMNHSCWEPILIYGKIENPPHSDVIDLPISMQPEAEGHPCPKPIKLFSRLIRMSINNGTVLDPFMGSGTTLRAAKDLGLPCIGIELEEKYCEIAARRLEQEVFDFGDAK